MSYQNVKVYRESYHNVGIKPQKSPFKRRGRRHERIVEVPSNSVQNGAEDLKTEGDNKESKDVEDKEVKTKENNVKEIENEVKKSNENSEKKTRSVDIRKYFDELYKEYFEKRKAEKREIISNKMRAYFQDEKQLNNFLDENFERKRRNAVVRSIMNYRKANSRDFNYFCTFTYDSKKLSEEEFRRRLKYCFWNFHKRNGWEYMGVWEQGERNGRWHFHGLFDIPEGQLPGEIEEISGYSFSERKRKKIKQSKYFAERFGRNEFRDVIDEFDRNMAISYISKYLEKSGERIVCTKGVKAYFITDVLDSDILCEYGVDNGKMVLSPKMLCIKEGEIIGQYSKETLKQMKKSN